jgi:hypothetical protein
MDALFLHDTAWRCRHSFYVVALFLVRYRAYSARRFGNRQGHCKFLLLLQHCKKQEQLLRLIF